MNFKKQLASKNNTLNSMLSNVFNLYYRSEHWLSKERSANMEEINNVISLASTTGTKEEELLEDLDNLQLLLLLTTEQIHALCNDNHSINLFNTYELTKSKQEDPEQPPEVSAKDIEREYFIKLLEIIDDKKPKIETSCCREIISNLLPKLTLSFGFSVTIDMISISLANMLPKEEQEKWPDKFKKSIESMKTDIETIHKKIKNTNVLIKEDYQQVAKIIAKLTFHFGHQTFTDLGGQFKEGTDDDVINNVVHSCWNTKHAEIIIGAISSIITAAGQTINLNTMEVENVVSLENETLVPFYNASKKLKFSPTIPGINSWKKDINWNENYAYVSSVASFCTELSMIALLSLAKCASHQLGYPLDYEVSSNLNLNVLNDMQPGFSGTIKALSPEFVKIMIKVLVLASYLELFDNSGNNFIEPIENAKQQIKEKSADLEKQQNETSQEIKKFNKKANRKKKELVDKYEKRIEHPESIESNVGITETQSVEINEFVVNGTTEAWFPGTLEEAIKQCLEESVTTSNSANSSHASKPVSFIPDISSTSATLDSSFTGSLNPNEVLVITPPIIGGFEAKFGGPSNYVTTTYVNDGTEEKWIAKTSDDRSFNLDPTLTLAIKQVNGQFYLWQKEGGIYVNPENENGISGAVEQGEIHFGESENSFLVQSFSGQDLFIPATGTQLTLPAIGSQFAAKRTTDDQTIYVQSDENKGQIQTHTAYDTKGWLGGNPVETPIVGVPLILPEMRSANWSAIDTGINMGDTDIFKTNGFPTSLQSALLIESFNTFMIISWYICRRVKKVVFPPKQEVSANDKKTTYLQLGSVARGVGRASQVLDAAATVDTREITVDTREITVNTSNI